MTTSTKTCTDSASTTNNDDLLKLDNQLCFALYVASKEIIRMYKPLLDPLGLTYTSYIAMLVLWEKDEITIKALGERLSLDTGTLTPLLKKMEADGLLKRRRSPLDERQVYIFLTDKGKQLKKPALEVPKQMICALPADLKSSGNLLMDLQSLIGALNK